MPIITTFFPISATYTLENQNVTHTFIHTYAMLLIKYFGFISRLCSSLCCCCASLLQWKNVPHTNPRVANPPHCLLARGLYGESWQHCSHQSTYKTLKSKASKWMNCEGLSQRASFIRKFDSKSYRQPPLIGALQL